MYALEHFDLYLSINTLIALTTAFILGSIIGFERQYRQRTAGLRTNVLVAVGAALFVDVAMRYHAIYGGTPSPLHVVAYVVSGVGFLGAGVIMREEGNVRGLNTAATLWGSAAVGVACGVGMIVEAILGMIFVLSSNTLLRPIVNVINRKPLDDESVEVTNNVYVIVSREYQKETLAYIESKFESHSYPLQIFEVHPFGEKDVEIEATLTVTSVDSKVIDALLEQISALPGVHQAFWSQSATD